MSFLAMILALVLLQAWGSGSRIHHDDWLQKIQSYGVGAGLSPALALFFVVAVPVVVVQVLLTLLQPILFGLLWIVATAFILLYSFGRGDFRALLTRYRSYCQNENFESAYLDAQSELGYEPGEEGPGSPQDFQLQVQRCLLYEGYQRWFAVLFYFVVIGPQGALAYRILQLSVQSHDGPGERALFYADWVPVRLLAATFTLAGDFIRSRDEFMASFQNTTQSSAVILLATARAALGMEVVEEPEGEKSFGELAAAQLAEHEALLTRSATSWLVVISMVVLLL